MSSWRRFGNEFRIDWAGREWVLRVDDALPGLRCVDPKLGPLLGLEGAAEVGRFAPRALSGATLVCVEERFSRVEATYAPLGWGALWVRAAWEPHEEDGMGMEVQIQARTVGRLRGLEVWVLSTFGGALPSGAHRSVRPRDARSAAMSYDGRETDLACLTTGPPGDPLTPWLAPRGGLPRLTYVELAHPDDVSRRIHEGTLPFTTTRYALFGHDLEKGVVLRARLRGYWRPKTSALADAERLYAEFLGEPLPLST